MTDTGESETEKGTVRDALAVPDFRRVFLGTFVSNTGRWMQNTALGVLAWELTESSTYLGLIIFAQLGPLAILSLIGGSLADTADRRKLILITQTWQMGWSLLLAWQVADGEISRGLLLGIVFVIGLGQGIFAPVFTSVIPSLAKAENIQAAVALNSIQINIARVIGPAIGGLLVSLFGFAEVFTINALAYIVVLWAVYVTAIPAVFSTARSLADRIFGGFRLAFRAPQVGSPLLLMCLFSLMCLPFIGQLPALAELNLDVDAQSTTYGWFYAIFGAGALAGSVLVGTVLLRLPQAVVVRGCLLGFGASLAALALVRNIAFAYPIIFVVGLFYFVLPTTLSTAWQEVVDDTVRGRVSALWVLSFGGTVPFANIIAGPIVEATSLTAVMLFGALAAAALGLLFRLRQGPIVGEAILESGR